MLAVVMLRKSAVGENEKMEVAVHGH
jgi:hypothetical protein